MNIQALNEFSGLCFLLGIVFFILAMVLFVVLRIPRVIGFFTGHAERKAIAFISEGSRRGGVGGIRLNGKINMQRLGLAGEAGEADPSLRETKLLNAGESRVGETELLNAGESCTGETELLNAGESCAGETELLNAGESRVGETELLNAGESCAGETELLNAGESCTGETELLTRGEENETGQSEPEENKPEQGKYRVEVELESEARAEIIR